MTGPVRRAFMLAAEDDEPDTPEEGAAVREARERVARGNVISQQGLARELGC